MVTQNLTEEEFLAIWALTFGHNWVDWLDAMAFKESLVGEHSIQVTDLAYAGYIEKEDGDMATATKVRLRTSVAS
jgi:hypothetical protein